MRILIWDVETGELLDDYWNCFPSVADLWNRRNRAIRIEFRET
jgi:hypothetical protein